MEAVVLMFKMAATNVIAFWDLLPMKNTVVRVSNLTSHLPMPGLWWRRSQWLVNMVIGLGLLFYEDYIRQD